jgi:3-deoxy-7-phosphoheptulonate synthase
VGADGLLIEVHPFPEKAFSDGAQSLTLDQFRALTNDLRPYLELWKASRVCAAAAV